MNVDIKYEDLSNLKPLGEGAFGKVFRADYIGTDVAVKQCFDIKQVNQDNLPPGWDFDKYLEREVQMLKEARHPNVVQYMGMAKEDHKFYIVTEYVPGGNLKEWILREQGKDHENHTMVQLSSLRSAYSFAIDIARALAYLHAHNIIHRDLKLENLLLTENMRVKVCDFGFSRIQPSASQEMSKHDRKLSYCGTEDYMAPELILCMDYSHSIDIFSFGIVFLALLVLTAPNTRVFQREIPGFGLNYAVVDDELPRYIGKKEMVLQLLQGCLNEDGNKRSSWKDIIAELKNLEADILGRIKERDAKALFNVGVPTPVEMKPNEMRVDSPNSSMIDLTFAKSPSMGSPLTEISHRSSQSDLAEFMGTAAIVGGSSAAVRLRHDVPHSKNIQGFMHSHVQCDDCGYLAHKKCATKVPPVCGLKMSHLTLLAHPHGSSEEIKKSMNVE